MTTGHEETEPLSAALAAEAEAWMAADPDPSTRAELAALLDAADGAGVRARFESPLAFGTAGLRGALGAGPARMNRLVVRATTAGVAQWVLGQGAEAARRGIVVGRDGGCSDRGPRPRGGGSSWGATPATGQTSSPATSSQSLGELVYVYGSFPIRCRPPSRLLPSSTSVRRRG